MPVQGTLLSLSPPDLRASTRLAAVIGSPVRHSLSPAMHNAAFAALGLDWAYLALEVRPGDVPAALAGVRALGLGGLSVTIPHKAAVAAEVDELTPTAAAIGAVNTVVPLGDGRLRGDNTDGAGFLASLADEGFDPAGRHCLVLGAGGAARAVVHALAGAGAAEVVVVNRSPARAEEAAALAATVGRVGSPADVAAADLVVNATPVGLAGSDSDVAAVLPLDPALLGPGQLVVDLVPNPAVTPWMVAARAGGAGVAGGLGMLVHQGALAFELWTGRPAPLGVMRVAALRALA
ncbi:MAG TPA: shikimate dehydrogenase [Acidimicrobiales bacterium]|nr:shikimate dehydrogenase [Acidimicrobiales bacterium]